jgi:RNA polymerase sigma-70 factor, ECF subfamily
METIGPKDAELVAAALATTRHTVEPAVGCPREAFGQLYDRHARKVRAVVAGVSGDWSAVEDMTQESFLRAYRNLGRLREPQKFGSWVVGIARQVGRERRRSLRRDRHVFHDPRSTVVADSTDGEAAVHQRDEWQRVIERLAELPAEERMAVHLHFFAQRNAQEAAELVGLSRSGFYALLQRAVARLTSLVASRETRVKTRR